MCMDCAVVDLGEGSGCSGGGVAGEYCAGHSGAGWFGGWGGLHHAAGEDQGWLGGVYRHRRTQPLQLPVRILSLLLESVKHLRKEKKTGQSLHFLRKRGVLFVI